MALVALDWASFLLLAAAFAGLLYWMVESRGRFFPPTPHRHAVERWPRVSIIVPARNEADVIERCLRSLTKLDYPDYEVLVVDGGSTDGTRELARAFGKVRVLEEPPLPSGWVGKSWACHAGAREATGEYLLFTDADTVHAPESLRLTVGEALVREADLFTGYTQQELPTFWERVVMPPIFLLIATAVGGVSPRSMRNPRRAIANGQYLLFRREGYDAVGGHAAVKGRMAEDLALARLVAARGLRSWPVSLVGLVTVRMYRRPREMWRGWRKNTAEGAVSTPLGLTVLTALTFAAGLLALPLAVAAALLGAPQAATMAGAAYVLMAARIAGSYDTTTGVPSAYSLLHPLSFLFFGTVLAASLGDRLLGRGHEWKGRRYRVSQERT
ncbi:MAG TPA: glycosyltransferase [Candidatus Thermoplasmatota archaeon]|nr:glycosyltransferase [Candidatus Thermoplasmatota archaeon]